MDLKTQYDKIRAGLNSNVLLMFRIGEYFEFFFQDAIVAAEKAGLKLENRHGFAMTGFEVSRKMEIVKILCEQGCSVQLLEMSKSGEWKKEFRYH